MAKSIKKPAAQRSPKRHREARGHVERSHKSLQRGMELVGHLHGSSMSEADATRSQKLATALGAGERAGRALAELHKALVGLDNVEAERTPAPAAAKKGKRG